MTHIPDPQEAKERMDRIAELLIEQSENKRSRGVLLKLFQARHSVKSERDRYVDQIGAYAAKTISWADGYLSATDTAIDNYLHARWQISGITPYECELICAREQLTKLFHEFGSGYIPAQATTASLAPGPGN